jgi:hypothetical protein
MGIVGIETHFGVMVEGSLVMPNFFQSYEFAILLS